MESLESKINVDKTKVSILLKVKFASVSLEVKVK